MKASDMISKLTELKKKYGDLNLVYSADDEGNYFNSVFYEPTPGMFNIDTNSFEELGRKGKPTHICIN